MESRTRSTSLPRVCFSRGESLSSLSLPSLSSSPVVPPLLSPHRESLRTSTSVNFPFPFRSFIVLNVNTEGFYESVPKWIASGEIHPPKEHIYKGLDNGEAFLDLMTGLSFSSINLFARPYAR
jgi:hypothetical protein